ncbi:hypothetical protein FM076_31500 [Streptomyces albus subsp. chlorinus]|uniref:hypothetical protein n=1 Tax=Streptomyces albus TaxID=1888 RepID=UPI00156DE599|nr:hypothetical protein [Streptomyces albus]NSC25433.1 hypothetical protein [Streptomyces albus subsp. chlorinus]
MDTNDNDILLFHNTMRITDGHLEDFRAAIDKAVRFAERNGPQLMVEVFVDEQRMTAHSFQLFRDSDAVRAHWRLADPYIQEVMEHCRVAHFEVFGEPDDDVVSAVRGAIGDGEFALAPRTAGFARFRAPSEETPKAEDQLSDG